MMMQTIANTQPAIIERMIFGDRMPGDEAAAWSDGLFMMILWFSTFFFVVLMGLMVYFAIKYRRRPGVAPMPSPHHNTMLEVFWTVVPSSSLIVMFVLGFQGYTMKLVSPQDAMELRIQGFKWAWVATYPNGTTSPELQPLSKRTTPEGAIIAGKEFPIFYLPEDTNVTLRMQSSDVIHSFWIPDFRVKMDVIPNRYTGYSFRTPRLTGDDVYIHQETGEEMLGRDMWAFCAEYCGDEHSRMAATIRVVPQEIYDQKMQDWGVKLPPVELGRQLYRQICASCHSLDGNKLIGPPWNASSDDDSEYGYGYPVTLDDGSTHMRDPNYYRESILDPNAKIVNGYAAAMASYQGQLSDEEIDGLIAFIGSLSDLGPAQGEDDPDVTGPGNEAADEPTLDQAEEPAGSDS
ncbi:MAG: cytochrome c oxidase subunit II [Phycisphaerales bacterium]